MLAFGPHSNEWLESFLEFVRFYRDSFASGWKIAEIKSIVCNLEWNILNFFESIYLGKKPNDVNYHYNYYYNLNTRPAEIASIFIPNVISNPTRSNVCRYE